VFSFSASSKLFSSNNNHHYHLHFLSPPHNNFSTISSLVATYSHKKKNYHQISFLFVYNLVSSFKFQFRPPLQKIIKIETGFVPEFCYLQSKSQKTITAGATEDNRKSFVIF
jgi:hypothetical protein